MPIQRTLDFYATFAMAKGGRCLSKEYVDAKTKYEWECSNGHRWWAIANNIQQGKWCRECGRTAKKNVSWLSALADRNSGKCLSEEYGNALSKYEWECSKGHRWWATANDIQNGSWCSKCQDVSRRNGVGWLREQAAKRGGKCSSTEYSNSKAKYEWECGEGHLWLATADSVGQGSWCPVCARQQSKPEREIFELVRAKFPDTQHGPRRLLRTKSFQLDVFVPSLKKAVEYDGGRWHRSDWAKKRGQPARDARKDAECVEAGIKLLRVRESEYLSHKEEAIDELMSFLGVI